MSSPDYERLNLQRAAASACKFAFAVSLVLPGFVERSGSAPGFLILIVGWLGPVDGIFAWYANPLLYLSLRFSKSSRAVARGLAIGGLCLALTALSLKRIPYDDGYHEVLSLGVGYYLWLASFLLAVVATMGVSHTESGAASANQQQVSILGYIGFRFGRCVSQIRKWH